MKIEGSGRGKEGCEGKGKDLIYREMKKEMNALLVMLSSFS